MYKIDLGNEVEFEVNYAGQTYKMREPLVEEVDAFRTKGVTDDSSKVLVNFLEALGMPADVVNKMGMSKAKMLVESITEFINKKK